MWRSTGRFAELATSSIPNNANCRRCRRWNSSRRLLSAILLMLFLHRRFAIILDGAKIIILFQRPSILRARRVFERLHSKATPARSAENVLSMLEADIASETLKFGVKVGGATVGIAGAITFGGGRLIIL